MTKISKTAPSFSSLKRWVIENVLTSIFIVALLCFGKIAVAQEPLYQAPTELIKANITNADEALTLLNSTEFKQQFTRIANQLSQAVVNEQSLFIRKALMSARKQCQALEQLIAQQLRPMDHYLYQVHCDKMQSKADYSQVFSQQLQKQSNIDLYHTSAALGWSVSGTVDYMVNVFKGLQGKKQLTQSEAINLVTNGQIHYVVTDIIPMTRPLISAETNKRYIIEPEILVKLPNDISLTATIVRPKNTVKKLSAAFQFTIYADESSHIQTATRAAANGYAGVIINSRGKRLSKNAIVPYENEGKDANQAIDWIINQPWSNGEVVMYGGSYNGFTQWAAAKYHHPALKAIAPYVAANLATGLPMENNIFLTANYQWAFFVTNNNSTDGSEYADWQHWQDLRDELFTSGRAFNEIDQIEGRPNPWFQKWLKHPSYDEYYQTMQPYGEDYRNINIPVLTVTGYFDGGQISAIDFLTQHYKYNKNANHSLLIGPYNHWTAQTTPRSHEGNYALDRVAMEKDTEAIVFKWFDHILRGAQKPILVQSKVNYQLMGANKWLTADSYQALNAQGDVYYLSGNAENNTLGLTTTPAKKSISYPLTVDMADRTVEHNPYPSNTIADKLVEQTGLTFISEPFEQDMKFAGAPTGYFSIEINKKDVDLGFNLYQIMPDGRAFHLTRYIGRASYAEDMANRQLLTPNSKTQVPIVNGRMSARLLEKGSRIALILDVNKNKFAQVNMGTGKDVSKETIADAGEKLTIKWFNDTKIHLPITPYLP